ncbi:MAG: histidine kinase [Prevotellaceae bacterium]|nr:histidine kinase [Prevotellaceae bacterium]
MNSFNPILQSYWSRLGYVAAGILIIDAQVAVTFYISDMPLHVIVVDAVAYSFLLAVCFLRLWYPIRYNAWEQRSWQFNVTVHIMMLLITLTVCMGLSYAFTYFFADKNGDYLSFMLTNLPWKIAEGTLLYAIVAMIYYLCIYVERLNEKASNEIRLNKLLKDGELNLLKSQINPHFLFNSLNSLNSLIVKDANQSQEMLVALSDYLRYTVLATHRKTSTLKEEMENIRRYLSIEQLRFGDKLAYEFSVADDCLPLKLPAMLLQPLFENAVKHGVYESTEAVSITAKAARKAQHLHIEISNNFDAEATGGQRKGSGIGLKNTKEQLRLLYGASALLQTKVENGKFVLTLKIPV